MDGWMVGWMDGRMNGWIDECFANAKCASSMYTEMSFIYEQVVHDIRFNNCRDDYIIAMNSL